MRFGRTLFAAWLAFAIAGCFALFDFSDYQTGEAARIGPPGTATADGGATNGAFGIAIDPAEVTVSDGEVATVTVQATRTNGFTGSLALFLAGGDGEITATFDHPLLDATQTSATLSLKLTSALTAAIDVDVRVQAKSGAATAEAPLRLHLTPPSGSPDLTLGDAGTLTIATATAATVYDLAIAPDGTLVIGGDLLVQGKLRPLVTRVTSGDAGFVALSDPQSVDASARAVEVEGDNTVLGLAVRPPNQTQSILFRLTGQSASDHAVPDPGTGAMGCDVALGAGDSSYVLLATTLDGGHPKLVVEALESDGGARAGFGKAGRVVLPWAMRDDDPCGSILVLDGGRPLLLGKENTAVGLLALLRSDGSLDPGFGDAGGFLYQGARAGPDTPDSIDPHGIAIDGDRVVVLSARTSSLELEVMRFLANGARDLTFNGTGILESPTDQSGYAVGHLAIDASHRILTLARPGRTPGKLVIRRILENGSYDTSFAGTGVIGIDATLGAIAIQPDGKIVVAHGTDTGVIVHRWYP